MITIPSPTPAPQAAPAARTRPATPIARAARSLLRSPVAVLALAWLALILVVSVLAGHLAPDDPLTQDLTRLLQTPSGTHLLGTDSLGRDVLSRLMHGGGTILWGAAEASAVAVGLGLPAGLISGYRGGLVDTLTSWMTDLAFAVPAFVVLVAVAVIYPDNTVLLMAVLGVLMAGAVTRLVRNSTRAVRDELFVDAARVSGLRPRAVIRRHIMPTVLAPVVMLSASNTATGVLLLSSLSFLGLGGSPETPSWGQMIYEASQNIGVDPWLMVPPGLVLVLTVMSFNVIASTTRDALPGSSPARTLIRLKRRPKYVVEPPHSDEASIDDPSAAVPVLDIDRLVIGFSVADRMLPVVDGLSLRIAPGQTLGVVGESGSGKTVTALSVPGLLPPAGQVMAGSVRFKGELLTGRTERQLRDVRGTGIAYVAQEPMAALDPSFTVGSQLGEALRHFGTGRAAAKERTGQLLADVGISDPARVAQSFPHQMSGGMAQRVAIALALAGDPDLIVADEPTTALDVTVQAGILDLFRDLVGDGRRSLLLVTHDLGVVADICDTVAVMYAGQIVEQGPTAEVLRAPRHPYTMALLDSAPTMGAVGRLHAIDGSVPAPGTWPQGCRFADRCRFVQDACRTAPLQLLPVTTEFRGPEAERRLTRCLRSDDIALESAV
ncbi:dipeptide/oligopeptide/nickel ABC transporter permease/ATP-binding protein [Streptacidiphilus sp. PAMC 29251]